VAGAEARTVGKAAEAARAARQIKALRLAEMLAVPAVLLPTVAE
jgi:hypothetical protein